MISLVLVALACQPGPDVSAVDFVRVPAGSFSDGSRDVTLTHGFDMMRAEVTLGEYTAALGPHTGRGGDDPNLPVDSVSWFDAAALANAWSDAEGLEPCYSGSPLAAVADPYACEGYRLPTDAEWEYAARAAGADDFVYSGSDDPDEVAWTLQNSGSTPHVGCELQPNGLGLCDMSGNIMEWVEDACLPDGEGCARPDQGTLTDPLEGDASQYRIVRGGFWAADPYIAEVGFRLGFGAETAEAWEGFRLVRTAGSR